VRRSISTSKPQTLPVTGNTSGSSSSSDGASHKGKVLRKWSWKAGAGWTILSVLDWWLLAVGGWLSWRGVFMRWTPLGLCMIAAVQWHLHNKALDQKGLPRTAAPWQVRYGIQVKKTNLFDM
jgi:hypothetical protein